MFGAFLSLFSLGPPCMDVVFLLSDEERDGERERSIDDKTFWGRYTFYARRTAGGRKSCEREREEKSLGTMLCSKQSLVKHFFLSRQFSILVTFAHSTVTETHA